MNTDSLKRFLEPMKRRIMLLLGRGLVGMIDDSQDTQTIQVAVLKDEVHEGVPHHQNFGFSSNPPKGSVAVLCFPNGDRASGIAVIVEDPTTRKKNLAAGEAALHNAFGDYVWIKANGEIEIKASLKVTVTAPLVHMTGNLTVDGLITATGGVTAPGGVSSVGAPTTALITDGSGDLSEMRTVYNTHTHPQQGGGATSAPTQQMT